MYKLLNWLFGWDYVAWYNIYGAGLARVYKNPDGVVWHWRYKNTKVVDIITHETLKEKVYGQNKVVFLTCSASKYLGEIS